MADIAKIELVVKSSVGHLVAAEQVNDYWRCHIHIPRNIEGRLKAMQKAFPEMEVESRLNKDVIIRIPAPRANTNGGQPAVPVFGPPRPTITINGMPTLPIDGGVLSLEDQAQELAQLYRAFFAASCEAAVLEGGRLRITFQEPLRFPSRHPFLALIPRLLPDYTVVAQSAENMGRQRTNALFLAKAAEVPRYNYKHVLIHIDGSYRDGMAAYGVRYMMTGQPPAYLAGAVNSKDSSGAELIAFLEALAHLDPAVQNLAIFTDSGYVLSWIKHDGRAWMEEALKKHGSVRVQHIQREENKAAHTLANKLMARLGKA